MRSSAGSKTDGEPKMPDRRWMLRTILGAGAILFIAGSGSNALAGVKRGPYQEIKVTVSVAYKPSAGFERMRAWFADGVAKKNVATLIALLAPTFLWNYGGDRAEDMDLSRDAVQNFKVAFGFRAAGKDVDGGVEEGPYWDTLADFANDLSYYAASESGNLVCGPIGAELADDELFQQVRKKIETDDGAEWYFTLDTTDVMRAPGDNGPPIARVGTVAMPLLGVAPAAQEGRPAPKTTHYEVLLPSGKTGWVPVSAVRPLSTSQMCYVKNAAGDWKIAIYDESNQ